ncbi:Hsp33 family molecular chaperone HslO [Candidatus Enterococcus willemsii]|uniref:Uncharacterized protein n=1 Tax=Candidatus Enterococcus willemsii TaxID=1857215 RepID=A0ABQ6YX89_9ENTE|nr:Hsp33 family molecular chaperone HslO [Enterococcus sp. CU12B]KAF1302439.1 hypothetical protein BAU17_09295 [Enterococcus sp. CU12B]
MKNTIDKYLIQQKQLRLYILDGKQIYTKVQKTALPKRAKNYLMDALNIAALLNTLTTTKQRTTFTFLSANKQNKLSVEIFSDHHITGNMTFTDDTDTFENGRLQSIISIDSQFGTSHTSHSLLESDNLYRAIEIYYRRSEQLATYFFPVSQDKVLLLQPLPFADAHNITEALTKISSIAQCPSLDIAQQVPQCFPDYQWLEQMTVSYHCMCSKELFLSLLFALTEEDHQKQETLEAQCPLCGKKYFFTPTEIQHYLQ